MPADDIARLYSFTSGTTIQSSQVNAELNQIVNTLNSKAGRGVNNTFTGNNSFSGTTTLAAVVGMQIDTIAERTSGVGVTADGVTLKDSGIIFSDAGELTIASGAITATGTFHTVDTEGDAASDDLDTINGGAAGKVLILQSEADARDVVVKHNTGNIFLAGAADYTLGNDEQALTLVYSAALSKWVEVARGSLPATTSAQGIVELATTAETETGTDTGRVVTPSGLRAALGISKTYLSSAQSISSAGTFTLAHGFAAAPKLVQAYAKCLSAEHNFSVGDEVLIGGANVTEGGAASVGVGIQFVVDATNIVGRYGSSSNPLRIFNKTTGAQANLTNASWELYVRAFG